MPKRSAYSSWLNSYTPLLGMGVQRPADDDYQRGFATALMPKNLRIAMDAAQNADAALPL